MIQRRVFIILLAVLTLLTGISAGPLQQGKDGRLFEETGHWVTGDFYEFWKSAPNPMVLFGYPITPVLEHHQKDGVLVQYFQRARMEYDPSRPAGQKIQLAELGAWFYQVEAGQPADFPTNNGACRAMGSESISVCYAFLQFYDRYKGEKYLGTPISSAEWVSGRLVQYFTYARLEWRPEMPAGQRVYLTEIGRLDFDITQGNPIYQKVDGNVIVTPFDIQMYAFVDHPLVAAGEQQRIYIIVRDQYKRPLKDIGVTMTIIYPDGKKASFSPPQTNTDGLTQQTFSVESVRPNQVVQVEVETKPTATTTVTGKSTTWFRIWW